MRPNFRSTAAGFLGILTALTTTPSQSVSQSLRGPFEFELETLSGQRLAQTDLGGSKVVLVDYWGSWAPSAGDTVPALQALYTKYKQHGLEIVGLAFEGSARDAADRVRGFASEHGLTYHLALGTPALKRQIEGFRGYPTTLVFRQGFELDRILSGADAAAVRGIEPFLRQQLGLPAIEVPAPVAEGPAPGDEIPGIRPAAAAAAEEDEPSPLPAGVIFQPGDGDTGFDFAVEDVDGAKLEFRALRGKPVVLALTSTWDSSAAGMAGLLKKLQNEFGEKAHVLAASLELRGSRESKVRRIDEFRKKHEATYRIFPASVGFQKKIHLFTGMPMVLVFDEDGVLVLRESGIDADAEPSKAFDGLHEKVAGELASRVGD